MIPTGWNINKELFAELIEKYKPKAIAEVGCWLGDTSIYLAKNMPVGCKLYCIDTWLGGLKWYNKPEFAKYMDDYGFPIGLFHKFIDNITAAGVKDKIIVFPATSTEGAAEMYRIHQKLDLIYIDASHYTQDVLNDCISYFPLLNKGGVMVLDDYSGNGHSPQIQKAAKIFLKATPVSMSYEKGGKLIILK